MAKPAIFLFFVVFFNISVGLSEKLGGFFNLHGQIRLVVLLMGIATAGISLFCFYYSDSTKKIKNNFWKETKHTWFKWNRWIKKRMAIKKMYIPFFVLFLINPVFSQNSVQKKFRCQALVTKEQKENILANLQKNKDFRITGDTLKEYKIWRRGEVYALLNNIPRRDVPLGCGEVTLFFDLWCVEDREELMGVFLSIKEFDAKFKTNVR